MRLTIGLVVTAVLPLMAAGAAQAALASANRLVTTARPDLVSAVESTNGTDSFCFDKTITSVADAGGFYIGGYNAGVTSKSTSASINGNCVTTNAGYSPTASFAQVGEGAVRTTGNLGNRADSTALAGSTTKNGTRGLTTAPDLKGISAVTGAPQSLAFTYDEAVSSSAIVGTGGFHFVTSSGTPSCPALSGPACDVASQSATISTTDPNTVIVQFPVGGTALVTNAVRGYNLPGAVSSANDGTADGYDSAAFPGSAGVVTGVPTLLSAVYGRQPASGTAGVFPGGPACGNPGCVVVDYTFNEGVSVNQNAASKNAFYAYLSDGSYVNPIAVTEPSGTNAGGTFTGSATVRAYFSPGPGAPGVDAAAFDNYLVKAGINGATTTAGLAGTTAPGGGCTAALGVCAVVSTTTGHPNTPGSAPIGGNTGGFAIGFSTAPDAFSTTFDTLTNTASVTFDQRVFVPATTSVAFEAANYQLLDGNGNAIAGATNAVACSPSTPGFPTAAGCALPTNAATAPGPGPVTVYLTFPSPAVQVGNGKALEIRGQVGGVAGAGVGASGFAAIGGGVFNTTVGGASTLAAAGNLQQIVSPASVAARTHLRASRHVSHKKETAAFLRKILAQTKHHAKKHSHKK